MGHGNIALLACQYNNVIVIIRMAPKHSNGEMHSNGLRFPPDIPCGGRRLELGFRGWRIWVALRPARPASGANGRFYAGRAELG